jgi:HD-like signal output (HDOD) protein
MRILFVDDDPAIIEMLKKMVSKFEQDWSVQYALGGFAAVALLDSENYDVVVTDLNMPEINGVKILRFIQKKYPSVIRIVFSSSLTRDSVREVAAYTHRFIAKPCGVVKLGQAIENTLFIYRELDNRKVQKVLTKTGTLPSLPRVYDELMARIDDDDFSLKDAAKLIQSDIGMSTNILKQINLLGKSNVTSIEQAVSMLGLNMIRAIALSTHIFSSMKSVEVPHFTLEDLVRHSMLTAEFAKEITIIETDDHEMAESAFMAGVLHDLGIILLVNNFSKKYGEVQNRIYKAARPIAEVERNLIGISHGEIGAHLLALWGFPRDILDAVAFHEDPLKRAQQSFSILTAVYVGSYLAHFYDDSRPYPENFLENSIYLQQLNCANRLDFWRERCKLIYDRI